MAWPSEACALYPSAVLKFIEESERMKKRVHHHKCKCGRVEVCVLSVSHTLKECGRRRGARCSECFYQLTLKLRAAGVFGW